MKPPAEVGIYEVGPDAAMKGTPAAVAAPPLVTINGICLGG